MNIHTHHKIGHCTDEELAVLSVRRVFVAQMVSADPKPEKQVRTARSLTIKTSDLPPLSLYVLFCCRRGSRNKHINNLYSITDDMKT